MKITLPAISSSKSKLLGFFGEVFDEVWDTTSKLVSAARDFAFRILWRSLAFLAAYLLWPIVPGLLWNWSPQAEFTSIGAQIVQRYSWLLGNEAVRALVLFALIVAISGQALRVIRTSR